MVYAVNLSDTSVNPLAKFSTVASILNIVLPLLTTIAAIIFLFMFLFGAIRWLTSGGNPESLKKARSTFTFAVIGLIIVLLSFLIVKLLAKILGIDNLPL